MNLHVRSMLCAVLAFTGVVIFAASASAETPGPGWEITSRVFPTNLAPGGSGTIEIDVLNVGAKSSEGPVTVTDVLPAGLTATEETVEGEPQGGAGELRYFNGESTPGLPRGSARIEHSLWACTGNGPGALPGVKGATVVTCTNTEQLSSLAGGGGNPNRPPFGPQFGTNPDPQIGIAVEVAHEAVEREPADCAVEPGFCNRATIAGGGAPTSANATAPITVSSRPSGFRFVGFDGWASNADGTLDTQAGSHPYELTVSFDLANVFEPHPGEQFYGPAGGEPRDIEVRVPPGLIGDPNVVPSCTRQQLDGNTCPETSQVGLATATAFGEANRSRVYNMVPPAGVPAEIGFHVAEGFEVHTDFAVRTGSDYGLTAHAYAIPERNVSGTVLTLWGSPGDASHDAWRTEHLEGCNEAETTKTNNPNCKPVSVGNRPFLTLPTACQGPQTWSIRATNWGNETTEAKASFTTHDSNHEGVGYTGCGNLAFAPTISTAPDTARADTPAGLTVEVKPQIGGLTDPEGLGSADIQNTTVTLPEGFVINPGQAAGLQACQPSQSGVGTELEPSCPNASKVGTDQIETPLLKDKLEGNVYVLQSNPPELKLLVAASGDGVSLKLVGVVHLNEHTGQLETKFEGTPELPFTDFKLSFSGGAQAALDTPTQCGTYTTDADFNPWSSPFVADSLTSAAFGITTGPGGGPCPSSPLPFAPAMTAGSTTDHAGSFTSFSLLLQRGDGQQRIERLQFREPAGLAGMISSVPLCPEPQASGGGCSEASKIGHAAVASGPGPYPLTIPQPGNPESPIFLTGPYQGAPFGLSILTHVIAGPFNLGDIVTRAKIEIDPHTAQVIITTDPFPQIVAGVPTDLRLIDSVIDRPNFLFNPTNCMPAAFEGTAWGTPPPGAGGPGATAPISSRFGIGSCRELGFTPKFSVSTSGKTSRTRGAALTAKVSEPPGAVGTQANITKVKVELPKQLPSRLTTLQKACTAAQFELNPADCPTASKIGMAVVHTQLLPVPLVGPAIFVSHGGEAFPSLTLVLQGYGVTVDLVGSTFINKAGITSTTFKTVPDVPFESFELTLPEGPFSALAANGNLCALTRTALVKKKVTVRAGGRKRTVTRKVSQMLPGSLVMPNEFVAQNGAIVHQTTPIAITGCPKAKKATHGKSARKRRATKHHKKK